MADYYKNIDKLCDDRSAMVRSPDPSVKGISYTVLSDLPVEPVGVDDFKQHARVDFNTDDNLIDLYLKAARQYLESWSQLSFGKKTIRFRALRIPSQWKLMYGPYVGINTPGYTLFDDILMEGGNKVDVELETDWAGGLPDVIKVAICRYASGLYAQRENLIFSINGVPHEPTEIMDEAQKMLDPYRNVTWP